MISSCSQWIDKILKKLMSSQVNHPICNWLAIYLCGYLEIASLHKTDYTFEY